MKVRRTLYVITLLACTACRDEPTPSPDTAAPDPTIAAPAAEAAPSGPSEADRARERVELAWSKLRASKGSPLEQRIEPLSELLSAFDASSKAISVQPYRPAAAVAAADLLRQWKEIDEQERAAAKSSLGVLEAPKLDLPEYAGAFMLGGVYRGTYNGGGIVVESRGKHYIVRDAVPPDMATVSGYVEPTGQLVTLALGRDGRDAEVVTLSDRETYIDDRKAHRQLIADLQREHQEALAEYRRFEREHAAELQAAKKAKADRDKTKKQLESDMTRTLEVFDAFKVGVDAGAPPRAASAAQPAAAASAAASAAVVEAAKPTDGTTVSVLDLPDSDADEKKKAESPAAPAPPKPKSAPPAPKPATPAGGEPTSKAVCLQGCIAGCASDPACERGCVTKQCK